MADDKNAINREKQEEMQRKENDRGEINMGGREFTGNSSDIETSSTGLPTMKAEQKGEHEMDHRDDKNSETAEKS